MGKIFDQRLAKLYEAWEKSPAGIALDRLSSQLIIRLLNPQRGERILDIGCGSGNHLLLFYRLGLDVTGVDASPYMLDVARSRLGHKACLEIGRAEELPFEDNEFDIGTLINTLEFLDDPLAAIQEAGRVARDRVFLGVLNGLSPKCICRKCSALFTESIFKEARLFTIWGLRGFVKKTCGDVPMEWGSVVLVPSFLKRYGQGIEMAPSIQSYPFGVFLGLVFDLTYTLKTVNLKVTERLKEGAKSPIRRSGS